MPPPSQSSLATGTISSGMAPIREERESSQTWANQLDSTRYLTERVHATAYSVRNLSRMRKLALSVSRIFSSFFFFIKIIGALSSYGLMASFHDYEMVLHFLSKESPPFFFFFSFPSFTFRSWNNLGFGTDGRFYVTADINDTTCTSWRLYTTFFLLAVNPLSFGYTC